MVDIEIAQILWLASGHLLLLWWWRRWPRSTVERRRTDRWHLCSEPIRRRYHHHGRRALIQLRRAADTHHWHRRYTDGRRLRRLRLRLGLAAWSPWIHCRPYRTYRRLSTLQRNVAIRTSGTFYAVQPGGPDNKDSIIFSVRLLMYRISGSGPNVERHRISQPDILLTC